MENLARCDPGRRLQCPAIPVGEVNSQVRRATLTVFKSLTTIDMENDMETEQQDESSPVAPGEILSEEFLAGYELTQAQFA